MSLSFKMEPTVIENNSEITHDCNVKQKQDTPKSEENMSLAAWIEENNINSLPRLD